MARHGGTVCGRLFYRTHWPVHKLWRTGRVCWGKLRRECRLGRPRGHRTVREAVRHWLPLRRYTGLWTSQLRRKGWQGWPRVYGGPILSWMLWISWLRAPFWRQSRRFGLLRCILGRLHGLPICIRRRRNGRRRCVQRGRRGLVDGHNRRVFGEDALQHGYEISYGGFLLKSANGVEKNTDHLTSQYLAHCAR